MASSRVLNHTGTALGLTLFLLAGCNAIVGLDKLQVTDQPADSAGSNNGGQPNTEDAGSAGRGGSDGHEGGSGGKPSDEPGGEGGMAGEVDKGDCSTNQECTDRFSEGAVGTGEAGGAGVIPGACIKKPVPHCVKLLTEDCDGITGDYTNNQAIFVGSLFSTKGPTAATNLPRQQAAALGIEQINMAGGVPAGSTSANARPLVMVSCDESTNLVRAATHLVDDLHVPAIVGPNTSQDTLDVSTKVTVPGGTVVMSPTGVASSIAALSDNDLTWLMVPSDVQRAPLMINQIGVLETTVKSERSKSTAKLGIVFRNDALGIGTRTALNDLMINGKSLANNENVQINPYNGADADQQALVAKYLEFLPDIIVLAGTAEAITKVMVPLETQWPKNASDQDLTPRPYYVLIDSTKVPELLTAVSGNGHDLAKRVRGTGINPGPMGSDSADTYNGFLVDYGVRYNGASATISGMGPAHDAAYAIGLALAATHTEEVSGASVAEGLRKLAGGATKLKVTGPNVLPAFQKLAAGEKITAIGTFGALDWDPNGAVQGGTLEMWCIGGTTAKPAYASSGLLFDIKTQTMSGTYTPCTP
ncbi:MAG TPA: ABC transporter substrate-binding protein [Polyangiaceae bacterium]|nr:ABC transporter substrate-binding protein [Polyangiaceae bacterium]